MQILAASLSKISGLFLHAGYLSAYPRTFGQHPSGLGGFINDTTTTVSMADALQLQDGNVASAAPPGAISQTAVTFGASGPWLMLGGVACFVALLAVSYWFRRRSFSSTRVALLLGTAITVTLLATALATRGRKATPRLAPWAGVTRQDYKNPDQATRAILYGIIGDALANADSQPVSDLAALRDEVGLPTANLGAGEKYALKTYGYDGWGRRFRLAHSQSDGYEVTSAGPDGRFDTRDDVTLRLQRREYGWESWRAGIYLRQLEAGLGVFVHRSPTRLFKYANQAAARQWTGTELFDVLLERDLRPEARTAALALYRKAAPNVRPPPLLLVVPQSVAGGADQSGRRPDAPRPAPPG